MKYKVWFNMPNPATGKLSRVWSWLPDNMTVQDICRYGVWMDEQGSLNPLSSEVETFIPGHQIICVVKQ